MPDLKSRIAEDVKAALKAGDKQRLGVLRMLTAAIRQREIDARAPLDDAAVLGLVEKQIKQRREAQQAYRDGNRPELAAAEAAEIEVLNAYLPQPLAESELESLIQRAIADTGAVGMQDMGKVMAWLKPQVQGRVDMGKLSGQVKARLG